MNKTVLVIGGAGYIGSYVNKQLARKGYTTIILDDLSRGDKRSCLYGRFIEGDLGDKALLRQLFSKYPIDAVMHFAAFTDVGESVKNPAKYYENNVVKTIALLDTMVECGVKYFLFSSSAAIFGIPENEVVKEDSAKNPINPYGETKLIVEKVLQDYGSAYDLIYTSLRYFNAAGADPEGEIKIWNQTQSNLIPTALRSLSNPEKKLQIFGTDYPTTDGTGVRDYIHIHDLAQAHILSLENIFSTNSSTFFNLGNGNGFSVREVLSSIEKVTGKKLLVEETRRRAGDPAILIADSSHAEKTLGWKQKYSDLDTIISHMWTAMQLPINA